MKKYEIITDSCSDMPIGFIEENKIRYVGLTCRYEGNEYRGDFGKSLSYEKFYDDMRNKVVMKTSQPNVEEYYNIFKNICSEGKQVIYVCVSSGLSGTKNGAMVAKNMVKDEITDANIYIIDILTASLGQAFMVMKAVEMQKKGATAEEVVETLEAMIQHLNTYITVDDLNHLKRGGRISGAAAAIGSVLHIKPILTINHEGKVMPVLKIKGKKKAIDKIVEITKERIENPQEQIVMIGHGDCIEEALRLKNRLIEEVGIKDAVIDYIGPVVGVYGGPGALALFYMGKERQHHVI